MLETKTQNGARRVRRNHHRLNTKQFLNLEKLTGDRYVGLTLNQTELAIFYNI